MQTNFARSVHLMEKQSWWENAGHLFRCKINITSYKIWTLFSSFLNILMNISALYVSFSVCVTLYTIYNIYGNFFLFCFRSLPYLMTDWHNNYWCSLICLPYFTGFKCGYFTPGSSLLTEHFDLSEDPRNPPLEPNSFINTLSPYNFAWHLNLDM